MITLKYETQSNFQRQQRDHIEQHPTFEFTLSCFLCQNVFSKSFHSCKKALASRKKL